MHTPQYRAYLITARYKDNPGMKDDPSRSTIRLARLIDEARLDPQHITAAVAGMVAQACRPGDIVRLYTSLNLRDGDKIQKHLMHSLIDNEMNMAKLPTKVVSIAMQTGCALEKQWLIDIDLPEDLPADSDPFILEDTSRQIRSFISEFFALDKREKIQMHPTPNGYALITPHGFDTRELLAHYSSWVTVKKDAMLFRELRRYEDWLNAAHS